eukprot:5206629-Prymnesium_polylepis.1
MSSCEHCECPLRSAWHSASCNVAASGWWSVRLWVAPRLSSHLATFARSPAAAAAHSLSAPSPRAFMSECTRQMPSMFRGIT